MEIYYEDYRLKVVKNELGKYDVYDSKYGGRKTYKDKSKDFVDEKISNVLPVAKKYFERCEKIQIPIEENLKGIWIATEK